jgi:hypothetical protein
MAGDRPSRLKRPPVTAQLMRDLTHWNSVKIFVSGGRLSLLNAFGRPPALRRLVPLGVAPAGRIMGNASCSSSSRPAGSCSRSTVRKELSASKFKFWGSGELANARVDFSKSPSGAAPKGSGAAWWS